MRRQILRKSDSLWSVGYDEATETLEVEFRLPKDSGFERGAIYHYRGVPRHRYLDLLAAKAPGRYFARAIKTQYVCVPISEAC